MDQQHDFLTLFRSPGRHAFFQAEGHRDPFFDPTIRAWVVSDPDQTREFLTSANLDVPRYGSDYQEIANRFSIDFGALRYALEHIPLTNSGEVHARLRRRMAEFLAARLAPTQHWLDERMGALLAPFFAPGPVEVISASVLPIVRGLMASLIALDDMPEPVTDSPSLLFDRSIGMAKRRRVDAELAMLRDAIAQRLGPDADEAAVGVRLALLILGRDATLGTLGYSLLGLLSGNEGKRLCDIDYPDGPVATGVPHVERIVITPFNHGGHRFEVGQTVRILMQGLEYADGEVPSARFFGSGIHACLGRPVSILVWRSMTRVLATSTLRARIVGSEPRVDNYVFACPLSLTLELSE